MSIPHRLARAALCLSVIAGLFSGCPKRTQSGAGDAYSEAERWLLPKLFSIRVTRSAGKAASIRLGPRGFAVGNWAEGCDQRRFAQYSLDLVVAHQALLSEDEVYAARFSKFETDVISRLGLRASWAEGSRFVYAEGVRRGIFDSILRKAGRSPIPTVPPPFSEYDEESGKEEPFTSGDDLVAPSDAPASVMPFHYCSGTGGVTISGGDQDPYVRAHEWLQRHDQEYARTFDEVMRPFLERAEKVDRFDFEATAAITHDLRRAMVDAGLADEIQKRADRGNSNSGKQEATGESQERED